MKILNSVQDAIYNIKTAIQNDSDLRKLLYYDTANPLDGGNVTFAAADPYIVVAPIYDVTEPPFDKNTIISIALSRGVYDEELVLIKGVVKINILTRSALWKINGSKIRPLEIANIIIEKINHQKINTSHKLLLSNIELAILNENVNGYSVTFHLDEGSGLDEQF
jgi:hypothetical protein